VVKLVSPVGYESFTVLLKCGLFILDGVEKCLRVRDIHGTEDKVVEPPDIPYFRVFPVVPQVNLTEDETSSTRERFFGFGDEA